MQGEPGTMQGEVIELLAYNEATGGASWVCKSWCSNWFCSA
jgi:hypothetical protein